MRSRPPSPSSSVPRFALLATTCLAAVLYSACSSSSGTGVDASPAVTGGVQATGGQPSTGGVSATGGTIATGGQASTGGTVATGGSTAMGGSPATGGFAATGGTKAQGGTTAEGGSVAQGGTSTVQGGTKAQGGTPTEGGTMTAQGGTTVQGGTTGQGGTSSQPDAAPKDASVDKVNPATGGSMATGGASNTGGTTGGGGAPAHTGQWKLMALGDSITGYCYPQDLSKELTTNGHTNFTFIGTQTNNHGDCGQGVPATLKTEGHGGYLVTDLETNSPPACGQSDCGKLSELQSWILEKPDVVLMEYGTNDCWTASIPLANIIGAFGFVVDQFRSQNPNVIFFVAQITPMHPSGCSTCETRVEGLNALVPAWAAGKSTAASPVYAVDVWSALNAAAYLPGSTWTKDGVHPDPPAAQLMADKWYAALIAHGIP